MTNEQLVEMLRRVEWVRQSSGSKYACPFCHGISERDGGPGHQDDCEWRAACEADGPEWLLPNGATEASR